MFVLKHRKVRLMSVAFSPEGTKVAATGDRGAVFVWDLPTKELVADLPTGSTMNDSIAFLDERRLGIERGNGILVRDIDRDKKWRELRITKGCGGNCGTVSPDRSALSVAGDMLARFTLADPPVLVWKKKRPRAHWQSAPQAWSPCGRFLIEPNPGGTLSLRDALTGEAVRTFGEASKKETTVVAVAAGGGTAAWAESSTLHIQKADGFHASHRMGKAHFNALAFHPSAPILASANGDGKVDLWSAETGERRESFAWTEARLNDVKFDDAGDKAACCSNAGEVIVWDVDR